MADATARTFTLAYDVIVHQVVTHAALVSVRRDWERGRVGAETLTEGVVIRLDVRKNVIQPYSSAKRAAVGGRASQEW
ncbi:hypothetical protein [Hymenobacter negativus]|uniref:Uncharacterized protein n=1 Tax=Hymenobacter negativus TaxID=2795026 RepID=A0ABS3QFD0_9BACT|nr:hypothetical protein [Hymenobacter negativus]MBO2009959.1 hypothetical protein [Hymenobacter negativus]